MGFEQIARVVKLPGKEEPGANILRLVCDWLCDSSNGRWLLVVDNADDRDVLFGQAHVETGHANYREAQAGDAPLSSYLPQSAHGAVLITSRNQTGADLAGDPENVETLDQFDEHDALLLLRKRLPGISVDEAAARDLVHTLDCIPLAIAQATAYIMKNKHRMTITKYLATFNASESKQLALLDAGWVDLTRDHSMPNAVLTSWKITFDQISQNDALAANILSMMSVLDRQGVPEMLIRPDEVDELDFDEAIGTLLAYSLVFSEKDGVTYAMHRLVQISTRRWLEIAGKLDYWRTNALTVTSKKFPSGTYETWKTCEVLLPHARMVLCYTLRTVSERDELSLLSNVGWYIGERGDYREASQLLRTALEGREKVLGKEHRNTLTSVSNLASVLSQQGKYEEAEQMNRRALEGWEKVLRKEHPYTLRSVNNLASVLRQQGKCEEAEQMHRRALEGWEKVLVKEHPDTLTSVNNLAHLLERKGDYNTAAKLYRRACSGREKVLGRDHPDTIACQWDYSLLLQRLDKNGEDHRRTDPGSHSKSENIGADDDDLFYDACSQSSGQRE
ncbi:hypothetical protein H2203_005112 [Taxawa tesnikishii (nom. ined.)]|nr:hypothetical protein H2203_005112 [Dothideales sp. JES 119]